MPHKPLPLSRLALRYIIAQPLSADTSPSRISHSWATARMKAHIAFGTSGFRCTLHLNDERPVPTQRRLHVGTRRVPRQPSEGPSCRHPQADLVRLMTK